MNTRSQNAGSTARMLRVAAFTASGALTLTIATPLTAQQNPPPRYELVDLLSVSDSDFVEGLAFSVNGKGVVGGSVFDGELETYVPCYWVGSQLHLLDDQTGEDFGTYVLDINDHNAMVGYAFSIHGLLNAMYWRTPESEMQFLPGLDNNNSWAWAINNNGQITGNSISAEGYTRSVIWKDGAIVRELRLLPDYTQSLAWDINNHGEVAGHIYSFEVHSPPGMAVIWTEDGPTILPPLAGHNQSEAWAINDRGFVAGQSFDIPFDAEAVIWDRNRVPHLLPSPLPVQAFMGMNNLNQVVGSVMDDDLRSFAMLWSGGEGYILGDLVGDLDPTFRLIDASQINDAGVIAGLGWDAVIEQARPLVLIPVHLNLSDPAPGIAGKINRVEVTGSNPGELIYFAYGLEPGLTTLPNTKKCGGKGLSIRDPRFIGSAVADADGRAVFSYYVPDALRGQEIFVQVVTKSTCKLSNRIEAVFK